MSLSANLREISSALDFAEKLSEKLETADKADLDKEIKRLRKQLTKALRKYVNALEAQKINPVLGTPGEGLPNA